MLRGVQGQTIPALTIYCCRVLTQDLFTRLEGGNISMTTKNSENNVTELFQEYRLILRDVWNRYFWSDHDLRSWDMVDHFNMIKGKFFESLLMYKVLVKISSEQQSSARFIVVPSVPGPNGAKGCSIRIAETNNRTTTSRWDQEPAWIAASEMELEFVDFYDWNTFSYINLQLYLVRIAESWKYPDLIGREALVGIDLADVVVRLVPPSRYEDGSSSGKPVSRLAE